MLKKRPEDCATMAELRVEIDALDTKLLTLLAERQSYTDRAPALKKVEGIAAAAPKRRAEVIGRIRAGAEAAGFEPDVAEEMWQTMIQTVIDREESIIGTQGDDR